MSKKRRRQSQVTPSVTPPKTPPDARREVAARAAKALRSAEAMKLRLDLIKVYNEALTPRFYSYSVPSHQKKRRTHEQLRTHYGRPAPGKSVPTNTSQRRLPDLSELWRSRLPSQVRHQLQDGVRALACNSRRTRREVIFALRRAGKNGKGNKRAKWTAKSRIRCK